MTNVFRNYAPRYAECGLRTIPVDRYKRPLIRAWQKAGIDTYKRLPREFDSANIAVIDGTVGGIVRVDVDDPKLAKECEVRFGRTPVVIRTPRGGLHLCYRSNGEDRQIKLEGKNIDILGAGGFGIVPPSETEFGQYEFLEGSIDDLAGDLPKIRGLNSDVRTPAAVKRKPIQEGRNTKVFNELLGRAHACSTAAELLAFAELRNREFVEPLLKAELEGVVKSVWGYKQEGRLLVKGCEARAMIPRSTYEKLLGYPNELALFTGLVFAHGAKRGEPFVLAQQAAKSFSMSVPTMRKAQGVLVTKGLLEIIQPGTQGKRDKTVVRICQ